MSEDIGFSTSCRPLRLDWFGKLQKFCEAMGSGAHQNLAPGFLTQIKVILSGRAENLARPMQIRPARLGLTSRRFYKMRGYFAPAIAIAMIMPAILSALVRRKEISIGTGSRPSQSENF